MWQHGVCNGTLSQQLWRLCAVHRYPRLHRLACNLPSVDAIRYDMRWPDGNSDDRTTVGRRCRCGKDAGSIWIRVLSHNGQIVAD